jgi:uncharacterized protein
MQLNVLQELRQPLGSVTRYDISEQRVHLEDSALNGLSGTLTLLRTDRGLLATLNAQASTLEPCARCLVEVDCPVEVDFEEEFIAIVDAHTGARLRLDKNEEAFRIGPDFILDLREPIRQYGLMAEPVKPLCRLDCAGLCSTCGSNLNDGLCECAPPVDERLRVLAGVDVTDEKGK